MYAHSYFGGLYCFFTGFTTILFVMFVWWRDIVREGTFEGQHTVDVQIGLRSGMILFIVSEIMFFFRFFLGFFPFILVTFTWYWWDLSTKRCWCAFSLGSTIT
jgi:heme/copper-type cytochrome/quinol oxidase subunit 3